MSGQLIFQGKTEIPALVNKLRSHNIRTILVITGNKSFKESGAENIIAPFFRDVFSIEIYKSSLKLVDVDDVDLCLEKVRMFRPEAIIAIGGGAVIDLAKVTMLCCALDIEPSAIIGTKEIVVSDNMPLFVAIPTTAGSGSESTHFAVLYRNGIKYSVANPLLIPDFVALIPELLLSVPEKIAVAAGLDAFAQAIESFWSINATNESRKFSSESLELLLPNLEKAVMESDLNAYANVQLAANYAGQAINITKTTASHALSYPLTVHFGIPHGLAVFLTLPSVCRFNLDVTDLDCADRRGVEYVRKSLSDLVSLLGGDNADSAIEVLYSYFDRLGVSPALSDYGVSRDDIYNVILPEVNVERMKNNPRKINKEDIVKIMEGIL